MLIVCPTCATSYNLEPASLGPNGRQVRCVRCREVWHAELNHRDKLLAAADALGPVRRVVEAATQAVADEADSAPRHKAFAAAASEAEWPRPPADAGPAYGDGEAEVVPPAADAGVAPDNEVIESFDADAPSIVPVDLDEGRPQVDLVEGRGAEDATEPHRDIETIAARRLRPAPRRMRWGWPLSRLQTAILALILIDAMIVGWRTDFVRAMPQTASFFASMGMPVNLRGLDFADIATSTEQHDGVPILVVEGNIVNSAGRIVDVPRLKFTLRNPARQEIYSWTAVPSRTMLPPGEAVSFRTRLASPPLNGQDVLVRFITRRDIVAGER
jgi:predicted Zn finger-like uncharacterized protein